MVREVEIVTDSKTIKVGIEETRRNILSMLRIKPMTVAELADALSKDQSTIYRHIEKLKEHDYVEVSGEQRKHHIPEKIYSRTAKTFLLSPDKKLQGAEIELMKKYTHESAEQLSNVLSNVEPVSDIDVDGLDELMWAVWDNTTSEVKKLKSKGTEVTMKQLQTFQILALLKHYRNDPQFKKELDLLMDKAGI